MMRWIQFLTTYLRSVSETLSVALKTTTSVLVTLKVVSTIFLLVCFLSLNESTCQTRKSVFYFTSKALFVLEKIKF